VKSDNTNRGISFPVWRVVYLPQALREHDALPPRERDALYNAVAKLQAIGPALGYAHTSAVPGASQLRELRPRAGGVARGDWSVIAAIGPEPQHGPKGFMRARGAAANRLSELEE
jgi:hypothetical protein